MPHAHYVTGVFAHHRYMAMESHGKHGTGFRRVNQLHVLPRRISGFEFEPAAFELTGQFCR
jgi:hypothetical protein